LEHGELVAQYQDLDLLAGVGLGPEHDPAQEDGDHLVVQRSATDGSCRDFVASEAAGQRT
jgi:hypothetical protein